MTSCKWSGIKEDLIAYARSLGFDRVGVTSAEPLREAEAYLERWIASGKAGTMSYLEKDPRRRARPSDLLPGAKSVIVFAMNYYPGELPSADAKLPEGRISRYAVGQDYHKVIQKRLESFVRYLLSAAPAAQARASVDTAPLLERSLAQRAGLGFIGKNTLLITRGLGSWVFLASVITTLELPADAPDGRSCGQCRRCLCACPTQAITAPYELDGRRCIAYLTIEAPGPIDARLRSKTGAWIFGCDVCQEVCPHNARTPLTERPVFQMNRNRLPGLREILEIREEKTFRERFGGTPLARAKRHGLLRNACLAAAHLGRTDLIPLLQNLAADDPHSVVREQAAWAIQSLLREGMGRKSARAPGPSGGAPRAAAATPG